MSTKYLEINSTYRNRNQYPDPADFTVNISQSGTKDNLNANDPVSSAAPIRIWCPDSVLPNGIVQANVNNTFTQFIVGYDIADRLNKVFDYYVGITVTFLFTSATKSVITGWNYVGSDSAKDYFNVSINIAISGPSLPQITSGYIPPLTPLELAIVPNLLIGYPFMFIPNGLNADNYYTDCIIYNQSKSPPEWRPIISYNGANKLAGLDISAQYGGPITSWVTSDTYVLRKEIPMLYGTADSIISQQSVKLQTTTSSKNPREYVGSFIRFTSGDNNDKIFIITDYGGNLPVPSTPVPPYYYVHAPYIPPVPLPPYYVEPTVVPASYVANVKCVYTPNGNNSLEDIGITPPTYEILQFTKDNEVPFIYNGSTVSHQEMICYEIELVDLVLPNKILVNGGRSIFYPFVYVELQNVSAPSSGLVNILYSNNPNSTRKLFRCPIDDMQHNLCAPFIKIDSGRTKQTIKFKPNDNLHFAVYLPNGKLFKTLIPENYSPNVPNPIIQISALFGIKRIQ